MRKKRWNTTGIVVGLFVLVFLSVKLFTRSRLEERVAEKGEKEGCRIYYLLNIDGMKGLGHAAFLLVDEQGEGLFYSYNGMQYSLPECLLGKAGIGKMKSFALNREQTEQFLTAGDLEVSDTSECDNFDRALYRCISRGDYEQIRQEAEYYITVGDEYEELYARFYSAGDAKNSQAEQALQEFSKRDDIPLYQIYHHNCDTAARECIAAVDKEMEDYNQSGARLTPAANYKQMYRKLGKRWGAVNLGEDTWKEKLLWIL